MINTKTKEIMENYNERIDSIIYELLCMMMNLFDPDCEAGDIWNDRINKLESLKK